MSWMVPQLCHQGRKRNPNPKLFGPDIFRWGARLPCELVGAKKFGMCFETQENQAFWQDIPGFLAGYPKSARKVGENEVCVQFFPLFHFQANEECCKSRGPDFEVGCRHRMQIMFIACCILMRHSVHFCTRCLESARTATC